MDAVAVVVVAVVVVVMLVLLVVVELGGGGVDHGTAVMVLGTFGSCYVVSDHPLRDPGSVLTVKPNTGVGNWTIEGFSNTAASSFRPRAGPASLQSIGCRRSTHSVCDSHPRRCR